AEVSPVDVDGTRVLIDRETGEAVVAEVRARDRILDVVHAGDVDRPREADAAVVRDGDDLLEAIHVRVLPGDVDGAVGPGAAGRALASALADVLPGGELALRRPRLPAVVREHDPHRLTEERERTASELRPRHVQPSEERRARVPVRPDVGLVVE